MYQTFCNSAEGIKLRGIVEIKFRKLENGTEQMYLDGLKIGLKYKTCTVHLGNLFNGRDPALAEAVNEAVNTNIDMFANELISLIEQELSKNFVRIANTFVANFSKQQLMPDL